MSAYTAELLPPLLSLNLGGKVMFKKGVPVPVDLAFAQKLAENPRFHVTGLHSRTAVEEAAYHARPKGEALLRAIRDACDKFDVDDDDNWDRAGKHSVNALSKSLGYAVSAAERDRALGHEDRAPASLPAAEEVSEDAVTGPRPAAGRLEAADGKVEPTGKALTIKRHGETIVLKPKAAAALADIVEPDPTTAGAISG
jgi:hypothetical protein